MLVWSPHVRKDPAPFIDVETLNDSSLDFLVRAFCEGAYYFDLLYSIPEFIKKVLGEGNIEILFQHQKVNLFKGD
ncbi:MAG: small conductance mechanosensitive channel [Candidatus Azotimanducaceae bacterium]